MGVRRNYRDFAPRIGFAYQLATHTVLRGGYGLFYNPSGNGGAALRLFRHVPFGPILSIVPGDFNVGPRVSDGFPDPPVVNFESAKNPTGGVIGVAKDFRSSYAQQFNLTLQHEIAPWQLLIKAAYVGNLGRRSPHDDRSQSAARRSRRGGQSPRVLRRPSRSRRRDLWRGRWPLQLQRVPAHGRQAPHRGPQPAGRLHLGSRDRQRGHRIRRRRWHPAGPSLPQLRPRQFEFRHAPSHDDQLHLRPAVLPQPDRASRAWRSAAGSSTASPRCRPACPTRRAC